MFYSDKPIMSKDKDCLNRTTFSKQIAKAILSYTKIDNFTISLCGKWGTGKTSIINMVIEEIENLSADMPCDEQPLIVNFNPWNYSDCTQLISQFFQTLQEELKMENGNEKLNAIGNALQKYSSILDYTAYIPKIGQYLGPLKDLVAGLGDHFSEIAEDNNSLITQKKEVIEALEAQTQKIIVIIDDIDRLNNQQIRAIFQLVNSLAGFPNMIYLLSFDRDVVVRALAEEQKCDGDEYLEKIIQVPFNVPEANKNLINKSFIQIYADFIFDDINPVTNFDRDYWEVIFPNCISPFLHSMRDVNRILNTFKFKYGLMRDETNCIDLLAMTVLQISAPAIYNWIYNNDEILTGCLSNAGSISSQEQKQIKKEYLDKFKEVYPKNPALMVKILQSIFPKFSWKTGGYTFCHDSEEELRYKAKIASKDRIKRYFHLSLEDIVFTKEQIKQVVYYYSEEQLRSYFSSLMDDDSLYEFLHELMAYIQDLPKSRHLLFIKELFDLQTLDKNYQRATPISPIPASKCSLCVYEILNNSDIHTNTEIILNLIEDADIHKLPLVCEMIEKIEYAYGRLGQYHDSGAQYVPEADLEEIENKLLQKLHVLLEKDTFLNYRGSEDVYNLWNYLDNNALEKYICSMLQETRNIPKVLSLYANKWYGGKTSGWSFTEDSFGKYIEKGQAYEKICTLKNTNEFSSLQYQFKQIAIAFYLWCDPETTDKHCISESIVNELIPKWESI